MRSKLGFTLIELMTVLSIVAILAATATPSFSKFIKQDRIVTTANEVMSTFKVARSEAVKQEKTVTLTANGSQWLASIDNVVFATFNNDQSGVRIVGMDTQTITPTGESPVTNIEIADGDSQTTDRCFRVYLSGQSKIEKGSC